MTLIETLLVVAISGLLLVPMVGWGLFAAKEQEASFNRNTDSASIGLLRTYFIRDVASASAAQVGSDAAGTDCSGGEGAATDPDHTVLRLAHEEGRHVVYNVATSYDGSGSSIYRRVCAGPTVEQSAEVVQRLRADGVQVSCAARPYALGNDCGRISMVVETTDDELVSMTASMRAGTAVNSGSPGPIYVSPDVVISVDPTTVYRGESVSFDASGSSDPMGGGLDFLWEFGDGTTSDQAVVTKSFDQLGEFTVVLTATNSDGTPFSDYVRIQVRNRRPTAAISAPVDGLETHMCTNVSFAASGSNDAGDAAYGGSVAEYRWDYGDGNSAQRTSAAPHTRQYTSISPNGGESPFTVRLVVVDNDEGESTAVTRDVYVVNRAPTVSITANGYSSSISGSKPMVVDFQSNASDPDGACDNLSYHWDFGDGTTSTAVNPTKTYTTGSQYTARLRVTDGAGAAVWSNSIVINLNTVPTAAFDLGATTVRTGVPVSLTNQSSDPETPADMLTYNWTFPNASPATSGLRAPGPVTFTHNVGSADTFISATYTVALQVTDPQGSVSTTTRNLTVTGAPAPGNFRRTGAGCARSNWLGCQERYIDFAWNSVSDVNLYQLHVRCTTTLCGDEHTRTFTTTSTRFAGLSQGFLGTTLTYDARIRARDTYTGKWGAWSPTISVNSG